MAKPIELPVNKLASDYPAFNTLTDWFKTRIFDNLPEVPLFIGGDYLSRAYTGDSTGIIPLIFQKEKDRKLAIEYFTGLRKGKLLYQTIAMGDVVDVPFTYSSGKLGYTVDCPAKLRILPEVCKSFKECFAAVPMFTCTGAFFDGASVAMLPEFIDANNRRKIELCEGSPLSPEWVLSILPELGGRKFSIEHATVSQLVQGFK